MPYHIILPAAVGILAHHGLFIRNEWHMRIPGIIAGHAMLTAFTWYCLAKTDGGQPPLERFQTLCAMAAAYLAALFGSMTVYRLWFHRCTPFPGPKLAAVSKLWHVWHIRDSTNFAFMRELREKYGNVIRTGRWYTAARIDAIRASHVLGGVISQEFRN